MAFTEPLYDSIYEVTSNNDSVMFIPENVGDGFENVTSENLTSYYENYDDINVTTGALTNSTAENYYDLNYDEYYLEIYSFETIALGLVRPILVALTTITNMIIIGFVVSRTIRWNGTNLLFVGIALSNTMTGLSLIPNSVYIYIRNTEKVKKEWCNAYMILRLYVSVVFHTISAWQMTILSIERYLSICHPLISARICTLAATRVFIAVIYLNAFILHIYHLLDNKLGHLRCRWIIEEPCLDSCVYLWFSTVLQYVAPCIILLALTFLITKQLRNARGWASSSSPYSKVSSSSAKIERTNTIIATLLIIIFLIPELPYGVYRITLLVFKHLGKNDEPPQLENHWMQASYEIAFIATFFVNFVIYCFAMINFPVGSCRSGSGDTFKSPLMSAATAIGRKTKYSQNLLSCTNTMHKTISNNSYGLGFNDFRCSDK